jgi:integrase
MAALENRGTKRKPGPWRVKYQGPDGRQATSPVFRVKADALDFKAKVERAARAGTLTDPRGGRTLLAVWAAERMPQWRNLRASTRLRYQCTYDQQIDPFLGDYQLAQLDYLTLEAWVSDLEARPRCSPSTIKKARLLLGRLLREARKARLIDGYPLEDIAFPAETDYEGVALTGAELHQLASAVPERARAAIYVGGLAALRPGEILALRWSDLDLERNVLHVSRTNSESGGHQHIGPVKNSRGAGIRDVPMHARLVAELAEHATRMVVVEGARVTGDALVFPAERGGPDRLSNWRKRVFQPAVIACGFGQVTYAKRRYTYKGMTPHDLRRTACSLWADAGATPSEIAAWAGHRSTITVQDRYVRISADHGARVFAALSELID